MYLGGEVRTFIGRRGRGVEEGWEDGIMRRDPRHAEEASPAEEETRSRISGRSASPRGACRRGRPSSRRLRYRRPRSPASRCGRLPETPTSRSAGT